MFKWMEGGIKNRFLRKYTYTPDIMSNFTHCNKLYHYKHSQPICEASSLADMIYLIEYYSYQAVVEWLNKHTFISYKKVVQILVEQTQTKLI